MRLVRPSRLAGFTAPTLTYCALKSAPSSLRPLATFFRTYAVAPARLATEEEWLSNSAEEIPPRELHTGVELGRRRISAVRLPAALSAALDDVARGGSHGEVRLRARELLAGMRDADGLPGPSARDVQSLDAEAHATLLIPHTYPALSSVMRELRQRLGESFKPRRILDTGAGPGVGSFAFLDAFEQFDTTEIHLVHESRVMLGLAKRLYARVQEYMHLAPALNLTMSTRIPATRLDTYDVVCATHAFSACETMDERNALVRELWRHVAPGGVLIVFERGTPHGFEVVARARQTMCRMFSGAYEKARGHVVAPCPHDAECPMFERPLRNPNERRRWCHFSQRYERPMALRRVLDGKVDPMGDSAYAYCVLRKDVDRPSKEDEEGGSLLDPEEQDVRPGLVSASYAWPRIVLPPLKRHKHVQMDVCTQSAVLQRQVFTKSQGQVVYRAARKSHWGDVFPFAPKAVSRVGKIQSDGNEGERAEKRVTPMAMMKRTRARKKV